MQVLYKGLDRCQRQKEKIKFKLLQLNANCSKAAHDVAYATVKRDSYDFMIVSEPNISMCSRKSNIYMNREKTTAIIKTSLNQQVTNIQMGNCYVCVETREYVMFSVYISPNSSFETFLENLKELQNAVMVTKKLDKKLIVAGDFNAKHMYWGGKVTDRRGETVLEWTFALDLNILNDGKEPTLIRPNGISYVDLTIVDNNIMDKNPRWCVLKNELSLSDHQAIKLDITTTQTRINTYRYGNTNLEKMERIFRDNISNHAELGTCREELIKAYEQSTPRVRVDKGGGMPYWWTDSIQRLISEVHKKRKEFQKETRSEEQRTIKKNTYKIAKRKLCKEIAAEKKKGWKELCDRLDEDVYGDGYKIVMAQLRYTAPKIALTPKERVTQFNKLFVTDIDTFPKQQKEIEENKQLITAEELQAATRKIKSRKAPGPDGLPPEVIKHMVNANSEYFLRIFNQMLNDNIFPDIWKITKLILLEKPKKNPQDQTKYRPICLIDALAKVYENIINTRLITEIQSLGGFSEYQFGFRQGRTTVDAITKVVQTAREAKNKNMWCALITIDIKNAFNQASWEKIITKLKNRGVSEYLVNTIASYLSERKIQISPKQKEHIGGGVPQGSVLGPTLWNVLYDDIFECTTVEGTSMLGYADDLAALVTATTKENLMIKGDEVLHSIRLWLQTNKLEVAKDKVMAIVLNNRNDKDIYFELDDTTITTVKKVTYLGIILDRGLTFGPHLRHVCGKASRTANAVSAILPNIRGPRGSKRRVLALSMQSVLLYGAPIWAEVTNKVVHRNIILRAQRIMALRVASAYRTVSTDAAMVISSLVPVHLLAQERKRIYERKQKGEEINRQEERDRTIGMWQAEWDASGAGRWTYKLIPNICNWVKRKHGEITFYLTQILTGHGVFATYRKRISKQDNSRCVYCEEEEDNPKHTIVHCRRWQQQREELIRWVEGDLELEKVIEAMLRDENTWKNINNIIVTIMRQKEEDEVRKEKEVG